MPQNQALKSLVEKGFRTQELLDDRVKPKDGFCWWNGAELPDNNWGATKFTRTAAGNYSITGTGAGNWIVVASLTPKARLVSVKGLKVLDVAFHYAITVAAATTVDVLVQKTVYADNAAPSVTNIPFTYNTAQDTNAERITVANHLIIATITTPEYQEADLTWYSAELFVVLPGGGATIAVRGAGMHYEHDEL